MLKLKFKLFLTKDTGKVTHYRSMYYSRFIQLIRHTSFIKAYVKISYGEKMCNRGCVCEFANWGTYETKPELIKAVKAFLEE